MFQLASEQQKLYEKKLMMGIMGYGRSKNHRKAKKRDPYSEFMNQMNKKPP